VTGGGAAMSPTERSLRDALRRSELMSARLVAELDRVRAEGVVLRAAIEALAESYDAVPSARLRDVLDGRRR